jgi:hypothetical protein
MATPCSSPKATMAHQVWEHPVMNFSSLLEHVAFTWVHATRSKLLFFRASSRVQMIPSERDLL